MSVKILDLDPKNYTKHLIHGEGRDWAETNCYSDVWIELLHALGHEPIASLPFTFGIDFEGDQWTFFKFPLADLDRLYGLDVQELNIWQDLLTCIEEQVGQGRPVLVELDSYFLPDTVGTAYKLDHVKSTVAVNELDIAGRQMGYFHNQGYHWVSGDDFNQLFFVDVEMDSRVLPPYVEYVKQRRRPALTAAQRLEESLHCFRFQLRNLPEQNPFSAFKERFAADFSDLSHIDIDYFHRYSFATLRQYGACFELCRTYLEWLQRQGEGVDFIAEPIAAYDAISKASKVLQFQLARAISRKKTLDLSPLDEMGRQWQMAVDCLQAHYLK